MSNDKTTSYTRDVLVQMSDKQIEDASSKIKRLIRELEKKVSASKSGNSSDNSLTEDKEALKNHEVEYCYIDDERQRRQKFNSSSRRSSR